MIARSIVSPFTVSERSSLTSVAKFGWEEPLDLKVAPHYLLVRRLPHPIHKFSSSSPSAIFSGQLITAVVKDLDSKCPNENVH